jgi:periplasmic protein TonB
MRNTRRALTESFLLHGLLAGAVMVMNGMVTPSPKPLRIDVSLLEHIVAAVPQEQIQPEAPAVRIQIPAPVPRPQPKVTVKVTAKRSKPIPAETPPPVATVDSGSQPIAEPVEAPAQLQHTAKEGSVSPGAKALLEDRNQLAGYLNLIRTRIENRKQYPLWATSHRLEGEVLVRFIIAPDGQVTAVTVRKSSGWESLDQAALEAVQEAAPMPRPPDGLLTKPTPMELTIVFQLS